MKYLNVDFKSEEHYLALEEALLLERNNDLGDDVLLTWEAPEWFVVLGRSNTIQENVHLTQCQQDGVKILRRISGGGTVLQGPGCLSYSLILHLNSHRELADLRCTNQFILQRNSRALSSLLSSPSVIEGITDLAVDSFKVCGNAQARKKNALLFHGTFLLTADLEKISRYLSEPPLQPSYRNKRRHGAFLKNLNIPQTALVQALRHAWNASSQLQILPETLSKSLIRDKYASHNWNQKH